MFTKSNKKSKKKTKPLAQRLLQPFKAGSGKAQTKGRRSAKRGARSTRRGARRTMGLRAR